MTRRISLLLVCVCLLGGCKPTSSTLTIAVASSMQFAMADLLKEFHTAHPDLTVKATYGSSGNFFAQIQNQAPFDVFLAADMDYPARLVKAGLALDDLSTYAVGGLVLWAPKDSPLAVEKLGSSVLNDPAVKKIAIANPKLAPYGAAAVAALQSLKLYTQAEPKLVLGENIAQTAQFVESGAADIGFLALSHALALQMKNKGRFWEVPSDAFPPIQQGIVILKRTPNADAARTFREFLLGPAAGRILQLHGFKLPVK